MATVDQEVLKVKRQIKSATQRNKARANTGKGPARAGNKSRPKDLAGGRVEVGFRAFARWGSGPLPGRLTEGLHSGRRRFPSLHSVK